MVKKKPTLKEVEANRASNAQLAEVAGRIGTPPMTQAEWDRIRNGGTNPAPVPVPEKPKKAVKWIWRGKRNGLIEIRNGTTNVYLTLWISGTIHQLTKLEDNRHTTYRVDIGATPSCGCDGFEHRGSCKHVDALRALLCKIEVPAK